MKFIIGTKEGMTQVFAEDGTCEAVTILKVSDARVIQVKNLESDGYVAVQLASGEQKDHRISKAQKGHLGKGAKIVKEYRPKTDGIEAVSALEKDATFKVETFASGDKVAVRAVSKGKGFQGVVKRHNFKGGPGSHGQKHTKRTPGSIGSTANKRVLKGTRMAGRMGGEAITVKNLRVVQVNPTENILLISGAIPGRKGSLVEVRGL